LNLISVKPTQKNGAAAKFFDLRQLRFSRIKMQQKTPVQHKKRQLKIGYITKNNAI